MLDLVKNHLQSNKDALNEAVIMGPSLGQLDLHLLSQLKGQILAFEEVLKTKEFLMELTEEEVIDDKSSGTKSLS